MQPEPSNATTARPRVLVTGAGGAAGVAVIRSLRTGTGTSAFTVFATDCDPHAAGLSLANDSFLAPPAASPTFAPVMLQRCRALSIDALVTTVAEEIEVIREIEAELRSCGTKVWLPPAGAAAACVDKLAFFHALAANGVSTPVTVASPAHTQAAMIADLVPGPWIVKPRQGRGSRDVFAADSIADLQYALRRVDEPLVQTRVLGREFTVDVLADRDGTLVGASPRWRLATKGGISTSGVTFHHHEVHDLVEKTMQALNYQGIACLQGFLSDDGHATCIEVNPRFGGGVSLSIAAGAAFAQEFTAATLDATLCAERLQAMPGVRMTRYFDEVFTDARERTQLDRERAQLCA